MTSNTINEYVLHVFKYQADNNLVYKEYIKALGVNPNKVSSINEIPFLPIDFYKNHKVVSGIWEEEAVFESSGTTRQNTSKNYVKSLNEYIYNSEFIFRKFYGDPSKYILFALLPSYLEKGNSSLVSMVENLIKKTKHEESGFFLYDFDALNTRILSQYGKNRQIILWGVSYALLDFSEKFPTPIPEAIIMETGGMKGRRKEMIRKELHAILKERFKVKNIHSEYGMTELSSQGYAVDQGKFQVPQWMNILIRDINDPFSYVENGRAGAINIIDLANRDTCSFIETGDIGIKFEENSFEIMGRLDNSEIRGCNLLSL